METGRQTTGHELKFTTVSTSTVAQWRIKVSQIECHSLAKAPNDCFQYFTGVAGEIQSLNYPTIILEDKVYSICIRQEHGYCAIEYMQASSTSPDTFHLSDIATTGTAPAINVTLSFIGRGAKRRDHLTLGQCL